MRARAPSLGISLLLLTTPTVCSPWRIAERFKSSGHSSETAAQAPIPSSPSSPLHMNSASSPSQPLADSAEVLLLTKAWLNAAADPSQLYKLACSDEATSSWTDDCDSLAGSEQRKMQMAALVTICQHQRTSRTSVPEECSEWLQGRGVIEPCVNAFSHFSQYWTSFTTFSSRITETCHALSREHDAAVFKKVFKRMLFHQQQFQMEIVQNDLAKQERERQMEERVSSWQDRAERVFNLIQASFSSFDTQFNSHSEAFSTSVAKHSTQMQEYKQALDLTMHSLHTSLEQFPSYMREASARQAESLREDLRHLFQVFQKETAASLQNQSARHDLAVKEAIAEHQIALRSIVAGVDAQLATLMDSLGTANNAVQDHILDLRQMQEEGSIAHTHITTMQMVSEQTSNMMLQHHAQFEDFYREQMEKMAQMSASLREVYGNIIFGSLFSKN